MKWYRAVFFLVAFGGGVFFPTASAGPVFFGPSPYLSSADIPAGFYAGGPTALENFEDGTLGFGITASAGNILTGSVYVDSVDADDGSIDGFGNGGKSWWIPSGTGSLTFTFSGPSLPTAAGLVWTDGANPSFGVTFEAYGPGMALLGSIGPYYNLGDAGFSGTTAEDRFFGIQDLGGILAIRVVEPSSVGTEVDHVQFGQAPTGGAAPVPEPASLTLLLTGAVGAAGLAGRRLTRRNS